MCVTVSNAFQLLHGLTTWAWCYNSKERNDADKLRMYRKFKVRENCLLITIAQSVERLGLEKNSRRGQWFESGGGNAAKFLSVFAVRKYYGVMG